MDDARLPAGVPLCQPPRLPISPLLSAGVAPLLTTLLHRLSTRALGEQQWQQTSTEQTKCLLPPRFGQVCTGTPRGSSSARWRCCICAGYKVAEIMYLFTFILFSCCPPCCCVHPSPCLLATPTPTILVQTFRCSSANVVHLN